MDLEKLRMLVDDPGCSDDELLEAIKQEFGNGIVTVTSGEIVEISLLGRICEEKRPSFMQKFREWYLKNHGQCA